MMKRIVGLVTVFFLVLSVSPLAGLLAHQQSIDGQRQVMVEDVVIRGNRRIPAETIRLAIQTKQGDPYNPAQISRDLQAVIALGYFVDNDTKVFSEDGPAGGKIVTFEVRERPIIRDIRYEGMKSVLESELLEKYRERHVRLTKESQYDPVQINNAKNVLQTLLSIKGRPEATIDVEIEEISATSVAVIFNIDEGPRVRVVDIDFEGNNIFSDRQLRRQMKLVKESSLFTTFTSKDVYSKEKLAADLERVRFFMASRGYFKAVIGEPRVEEVGEIGSRIPLIGRKGKGLKIVVPVTEGRLYRIGKVTVEGNTVFPEDQILAVSGIKSGDVINAERIQKGVFENLKKLYGQLGYVQAQVGVNPEPKDTPGTNEGIVDLTIEVEEGKQYTLRRLEFLGNTVTRDNVLRREVLLNEGDPYNQRLWELSLLRLNQLGYFEEIKEEHATLRFNEQESTVDIDLKVQEKGRQQIQFTGGASGIGGSFIGLQYATNNFLGFGETLSFSLQAGNRQRIFSFGFTEPYLMGKPISVGFNIFNSRLAFFGGGLGFGATGFFSTGGGLFGFLGARSDELFTQVSTGATISASAPLSLFWRSRSSFFQLSRLGLSYSYSRTSVEQPPVNKDDDPNNDILISFEQPPVTLSTLQPNFFVNTLNHAIDPTAGQSFFLGLNLTGSFLGGNVNLFQPTVEYKYFRPGLFKIGDRETVIGMRVLGSHILPFGARFQSNSLSFIDGVPIFQRFFLGGEDTIRGFNIRSVSPVAELQTFLTSREVKALDASGKEITVLPTGSNQFTGNEVAQSVLESFTFTGIGGANPLRTGTRDLQGNFLPVFVPIGGDTQLLFNAEYRIPLASIFSIAAFFDIGTAFNLRKMPDQIFETNFLPSPLASVTLNPFGRVATPEEIEAARPPEIPAGQLPPGFRSATITGLAKSTSLIKLSEGVGGFSDYRASMGAELRVQMPVINVPFRLIFAYNPNARVFDPNNPNPRQLFLEERKVIRFSIGRTF